MTIITKRLKDFSKIEKIYLNHLNILLRYCFNQVIFPPLSQQCQFRITSIFNKYWTLGINIKEFYKLWFRLIGPINENFYKYKFHKLILDDDDYKILKKKIYKQKRSISVN